MSLLLQVSFLLYFLKDNCFTILCRFLPYTNMTKSFFFLSRGSSFYWWVISKNHTNGIISCCVTKYPQTEWFKTPFVTSQLLGIRSLGTAYLGPLGQGLSQAVAITRLHREGSGPGLLMGSLAGLSSSWAIGLRPYELLDCGFPHFLVMQASPPGISWHGSRPHRRERERDWEKQEGGGEENTAGLESQPVVTSSGKWWQYFMSKMDDLPITNSKTLPGPEIVIWQQSSFGSKIWTKSP